MEKMIFGRGGKMDVHAITALNLLVEWAKKFLDNEEELVRICQNRNMSLMEVKVLKHLAVEIMGVNAKMNRELVTLINSVEIIRAAGNVVEEKLGEVFTNLIPAPDVVVERVKNIPTPDGKIWC